MALGSQTAHHVLKSLALKYMTYDSPASTDIMFNDGRNILTTARGYAERRPGFSATVESSPTTFTGTIERIYSWRKWGGAFYTMVCETTDTASKVYKFQHGTD